MAVAAAARVIPSTINVSEDRLRQVHEIVELPDFVISRRIISRLPDDSYSRVNVTYVRDFEFGGIAKEAKVITLTVTRMERWTTFIHAFCAGTGVIECDSYKKSVDEDKLQEELLGIICCGAKRSKEIQLAYERCTKVVLGVSIDAKSIQLNIQNDRVVLGAYKIARATRLLVPAFLAAFWTTKT